MSKIYCGIGSRATPPEVLSRIRAIAAGLASDGWMLRSGAADGADSAFEAGCDEAGGSKEIWLPWRGFNGSKSQHILSELSAEQIDRAILIASSIHPAWHNCTFPVKHLHARNVLQVLGVDFNTPVDRVICWTPAGAAVGGTATALRLAQQHNIPITNLATDAYVHDYA